MVSIICCTMRKHYMENVFDNYENQDWEEKELIIILNRDDMDVNKWKERARQSQSVTIYQLPEQLTLGACLNYGIKKSKYDIIAKFDDDDYYSPHYLTRQMKAIKNTKADVVCKRTVFMYFENDKTLSIHLPHTENRFVSSQGGIKGATLVFKKKILEKVKMPDLNVSEDYEFIKKCLKRNYKVYATDKNSYACLRRTKRGHHTWDIKNEDLMQESEFFCKTEDYKPVLQLMENVVKNISTSKKKIALTFNDGPDPNLTPQILDLLKQFGAKAHFFAVGIQLQKFPDLAKRIVDEGHELGNHSYSHPNLAALNMKDITKELGKTHRIIQDITGKNPVLFRPPFRSYNNKVLEVSKNLGYLTIMHSIRANNSKQTGVDKVVNSVISKLGPGEIIMLNDSGGKNQQTVEALKMILNKIQEKGYQCVNISKLV
jgi:peptidoglycan/xylan/chitin deacetylase (PgdA/CDA1 family)